MTALISYNQDTIRNLPAEQREKALEFQLDRARTALALALEASDVHMVAQIKSGTAVMEKLSKELRLSKECQLDAAEMVRRSEYALGKAIRQGQASGTIRTQGQRETKVCTAQTLPPKASEFATHAELYGNGLVGAGIYALAAADEDEAPPAATPPTPQRQPSSRSTTPGAARSSPTGSATTSPPDLPPFQRGAGTPSHCQRRALPRRDTP